MATSVPSRIERALPTSAGRTQTEATSYASASRQPASTNSSSSSGRSSEWSIVLAICRSVRFSIVTSGTSDDQRPEDVARKQESALHELLLALEGAIFVLDG